MDAKIINNPLLKAKEIEIKEFFDDKGNIKPELISDTGTNNVKDLALLLTQEIFEERRLPNGKTKKEFLNSKLASNQVRKFYDNFLKIYYTQNPEVQRTQLLMLKAQIEYAVIRLKIFRFGVFLTNRISIAIKHSGEEFSKHLDALKLHFEALIGYFPK
jgi:CRISPR type III-A-associated protein Csm2